MNTIRAIVGIAAALVLSSCEQPNLSARVASQEFSVQPYRNSSIEMDGGRIAVTRTNEGSIGVRFRQGSSGWGKRYVIEAQASGADDLRLRNNNDGELQYAHMRAGETQAFVLGGDITEALIYSEAAQALEVEVTLIADCTKSRHDMCYSAIDMQREVFPSGAPENPEERMIALLDWASNAADYAATPELVERANAFVGRYHGVQMYSVVYRNDLAAGYCGATAVFFASMLREFGYEAVSIDIGVPNTVLTHVSVVARAPDGEFYLLDPTFNFHVVRRDTRHIATFREMVSLPLTDLVVVEAPMPERDYLITQADFPNQPAFYSRSGNGLGYERCRLDRESGNYACKRPSFSLASYIAENAEVMRGGGYDPTAEGFLAMFRGRYFRVNGPEQTRNDFLALLASEDLAPPRRLD